MPLFENLDFLNANTLRNFPLKEGVSKLDNAGVFTIPDDFMVDLIASVTSDPTRRVYVSKIVNMPDEIEVALASFDTTSIGTFVISVSEHVRYQTYYLIPTDYVGFATGKLVVGEVTTMQTLPYGTFYFSPADTEVEARTIIPGSATISKFIFKNADGENITVTGDVVILAQTNVKFKRVNSVTVAVDAGDNLGLNATCEDARPCIKTINSVSPDDNGNIWLTTSNCAQFTPLAEGLLKGLNLSDSCCKPCLSCNEIGDLTERLMQVETDLLSIRDHYNQLELLTQQLTTLSTSSCECT